MISLSPTVVGDVGWTNGTPKGVPLSFFVLEKGKMHTVIEDSIRGADIISGHMEDIFREHAIICNKGETGIACLHMPPSGFAAAMFVRLKGSGWSVLPGGHMAMGSRDGECLGADATRLSAKLGLNEFVIAFESPHGLVSIHGVTGVVPFGVFCRVLHAEGFRGLKPEEIETNVLAPARNCSDTST